MDGQIDGNITNPNDLVGTVNPITPLENRDYRRLNNKPQINGVELDGNKALEDLGIDLDNKVDKVDGKGLSTNDYTTEEKNKLAGVESGAEPNQNAFSRVVVGSTTIEADTKTDALTITAGNNITLTPNSDNDSITISASVPEYSDATTTTHGLMSVADKNTLDDLYNLIAGATAIGDLTLENYEWSASKTYGNDEFVIYENKVYMSGSIDGVTPTPGTFIPDEWFNIDLGGITLWDHEQVKGFSKGLIQFAQAIQQALQEKADINSPTLTGTPKAPTATADTNTTQIATTAFVKTAIDNAISGVTGVEFRIVQQLPQAGETGIIYLVYGPTAESGDYGDYYDEYIWISSTNTFELLGTTKIDLSGYVQASDLETITNSEIDAIVV